MKLKKIKFIPLDLMELRETKCQICKMHTKNCKCVACKFCGEVLKKTQECKYCKKRNTVKNFTITNAELNALEDLGLVDLRIMFKEKREKEVEVWQNRCKSVWHKLVRKIDKLGA